MLIGERAWTKKNWAGKPNGAQGRNRTTDTAIFSRMLYQLSYLGIPRMVLSGRTGEPAGYSGLEPLCKLRGACPA